MLFRPSFCCNCGENIERAEWKLWTSRRFCDLCATDFTMQEFVPKGVILLASVISVFGIVSFLSRNPERTNLAVGRTVDRPRNSPVERPPANAATGQPAQADNRAVPAANSIEDRRPQTLAALPPADPPPPTQAEAAQPVYICGAATKKGTPCSRRVKGNFRCWQHAGQPPMLPQSQLRASR
jgi:hypothetical protein